MAMQATPAQLDRHDDAIRLEVDRADPHPQASTAGGEVESDRGAVPALPPVRFPGPLPNRTCAFQRIRLSTSPKVILRPCSSWSARSTGWGLPSFSL